MPCLLVWYITAFRVILAKPILYSSASLPLLSPLGPGAIEQLDLNPSAQYSPLSDGSSTLVANPLNQDNPSFFGTADLTLTGQGNDKKPEQVTASAGLSDSVVQNSDISGQEVPKQGASALLPSDSVIQGDDSAKQTLPVQLASTNGLSGSIFQDSDSPKQEFPTQLDLPGTAVQDSGSGSSDQTAGETTPLNNLNFAIAQNSHLQTHSCGSNQAPSVKRQAEKRNPGKPNQPQKNPAFLRGTRPPKPQKPPPQQSEPQNSPVEALPVPRIPAEEIPKDECVYVPECENVNGQAMKKYCCPYVQRIGFDDRFVSNRAGCTDCSYDFLLFVHSVLLDTQIGFSYLKIIITEQKSNVCIVSLSNFMCERQNDWKGVFCCRPGYTVCTCFPIDQTPEGNSYQTRMLT